MNQKPLLARLELMPNRDRQIILSWMDMITECGYNTPSGKELENKLKARKRGKTDELPEIG